MKFTNHIAIIGCGIAGLTLACALRKFNIETVIFERNAELNEYGARHHIHLILRFSQI